MVVGAVFIYQMMVADIQNICPSTRRSRRSATGSPTCSGVVFWQALLLALFGYATGFVAALGLYRVATD